MNPVLASVLLLGVFVTVSYAGDDDIKTIGDFLKKFAHINIEEVLQNDRLFQAYHKCFLEQGPCTPEAKEMRNVIPSLVKTACDGCSPDQKKELKKHLDYAKNNRAKEWEELLDKYDPKREILEKFFSSVPDK
ncbi:ejaculatory bulb-specific protein 3-like [Planococcus citri]|uniref:ejaculatory bulb-specific protein 3-like n=1 Tax=Planococcus citri TaxID=170843 RepID=UPI0031F9BDA1